MPQVETVGEAYPEFAEVDQHWIIYTGAAEVRLQTSTIRLPQSAGNRPG